RPPSPTLFPYTTLFRSEQRVDRPDRDVLAQLFRRLPALERIRGVERLHHVAEVAQIELRQRALHRLVLVQRGRLEQPRVAQTLGDRKSTRLNSSHDQIS